LRVCHRHRAVRAETGQRGIRVGIAEQVSTVKIETRRHTGVVALVGSAVAGNEAQKHDEQPVPAQLVIVRMSNGV